MGSSHKASGFRGRQTSEAARHRFVVGYLFFFFPPFFFFVWQPQVLHMALPPNGLDSATLPQRRIITPASRRSKREMERIGASRQGRPTDAGRSLWVLGAAPERRRRWGFWLVWAKFFLDSRKKVVKIGLATRQGRRRVAEAAFAIVRGRGNGAREVIPGAAVHKWFCAKQLSISDRGIRGAGGRPWRTDSPVCHAPAAT